MASARALARTYPVASLTHWLLCEAVHSASDLSHRYMGGPGLEREWTGMERCLERNGPLQHSPEKPRSTSLSKFWQFGARVAQQAVLRLRAGNSQAHLYHQTSQLCHRGQQL